MSNDRTDMEPPTPDTAELHRRLVALEEFFLHAERRGQDLHEALVAQQGRIDALEARLEASLKLNREMSGKAVAVFDDDAQTDV